ncbi:hypothetical protein MHYP_G00008740 [Metynnis hypsauchen]
MVSEHWNDMENNAQLSYSLMQTRAVHSPAPQKGGLAEALKHFPFRRVRASSKPLEFGTAYLEHPRPLSANIRHGKLWSPHSHSTDSAVMLRAQPGQGTTSRKGKKTVGGFFYAIHAKHTKNDTRKFVASDPSCCVNDTVAAAERAPLPQITEPPLTLSFLPSAGPGAGAAHPLPHLWVLVHTKSEDFTAGNGLCRIGSRVFAARQTPESWARTLRLIHHHSVVAHAVSPGGTFLRCASTWTQQKEGRDSRIGEEERLTWARGKPVLAKSKQPAEAAQFETSALSGAV